MQVIIVKRPNRNSVQSEFGSEIYYYKNYVYQHGVLPHFDNTWYRTTLPSDKIYKRLCATAL